MSDIEEIPQSETLSVEEDDVFNESVANAQLLPDCIEDYQRTREREHARIGHLFRDFEQFEMFHMLPLSKQQKALILNRVIELDTAEPDAIATK